MNLDLPIDIFSGTDGEVFDPEDVIPEHYREELLTMRVVENRSSWRTGDIALDILATSKHTQEKVCIAVGHYRGLSPLRVRNILAVCKAFPPDRREFARPFSDYETVMHQLPVHLAEKALAHSDEVEQRTGMAPKAMDVAQLFKNGKPTKRRQLDAQIDRIIADVARLKKDVPTDKIIEIILMLNTLKSSSNDVNDPDPNSG